MEAVKIIEYPALKGYHPIKITMRNDFYERFDSLLKEVFDKTGATYFAHNIIKNYGKPGHQISAFNAHEEWFETYWNKFNYDDPIEKTSHSVAARSGAALTSWQLTDPTSACMEARTSMCKVRDGATIAFQYPNGLIENITFGWKKFDCYKFDAEKIALVNKLVAPLRQYHLQNHRQQI